MIDDHIRYVQDKDITAICGIYNYYVENTNISFEEQCVTEEGMKQRVNNIIQSYPWIVYTLDNKVVGYAYISKWKDRSAYRFTVEDTIYVKHDQKEKGIGEALFRELINEILNKKIHVIIAVIALPNERSIKLHEKYGFKKTAHFTEVGYKNKEWIDVGYWELLLAKHEDRESIGIK